MDYIKIAKVDNVILHKKGQPLLGTLHLTTHHLIFTSELISKEFWFPYPMISNVFKNNGSALISKMDNGLPTYTNINDTNNNNNNNNNSNSIKKKAKNIPLIETLKWFENIDIWSMANIKIIGKDYTIFSLDFINHTNANDVFDSLIKLTVLPSVTNLYAFIYQPNSIETKFNSWQLYNPINEFKRQGLNFNHDDCPWRISTINKDYKFCPTYPNRLIVPKIISDTILTHTSNYRSKNRIPTLCYYYKRTHGSISRSSQPLPGITKQRSLQDERLVTAIFNCSTEYNINSSNSNNIIVDARPMANALAQTALGGGTENMDNYNINHNCKRIFLGIDNIHVMSDTMSMFTESYLMDTDVNNNLSPTMIHRKANHWLKSIKLILSSVDQLTKAIIFNNANLLVHCSDGWDRTSQVCSLIQVCLDPYYRTMEGFMILIEKDWISFGHKFMERSGHLSSTEIFHDNTVNFTSNLTNHTTDLLFGNNANNSNNSHSTTPVTNSNTINNSKERQQNNTEIDEFDTFEEMEDMENSLPVSSRSLKESGILGKVSDHWNKRLKKRTKKRTLKFTSPIFQQFLDCVYQLIIQNPASFEFNEKFLLRLVYHLYSCQYGSFLFDCEKDIIEFDAPHRTSSVWNYFRSRKEEFLNPSYSPVHSSIQDNDSLDDLEDWIQPDLNNIKWWSKLYGRRDNEINAVPDDSFKKWNSNEETETGKIAQQRDEVMTPNYNLLDQTKDLLSSFNIFTKK